MRLLAGFFLLLVMVACASLGPSGIVAERAFENADNVWSQYESENFTLITDLTSDRTVSFLEDLEDFRSFARATLKPIDGLRPRLVIVAPTTREGFAEFADPDTISGHYFRSFDTDFMVINLSQAQENSQSSNGIFTAEDILRHEYIHAVVADIPGKPLPIWLNEGLAEYFTTAHRDGDVFVVGTPLERRLGDLRIARRGARKKRFGSVRRTRVPVRGSAAAVRPAVAPLDDIVDAEVVSAIYNNPRDRTNYHAQAWLLVHHLQSTAEGREYLSSYRALRQGHGKESEVLEAVLGETLGRFDDRLWSRVQRNDFPQRRLPAPRRPVVNVRRIGPVREADLWCNVGRFKGAYAGAEAAKRVFRFALSKDPENICALSHLSKLESWDGNFDTAEELTDRAEGFNGDDPFTPLSRAMLLYNQIRKTGNRKGIEQSDVEMGIVFAERAIEADPTIVLSHIVHATLIEVVEKPSNMLLCEGLKSALAAERLNPQGRAALQSLTGNLYWRLGHLDEAYERLSFHQAWIDDQRSKRRTAQRLELLKLQIEQRQQRVGFGLASSDPLAASCAAE